MSSLTLLWVFLGAGLATYLIRLSFIAVEGRLRGDQITLTIGDQKYTGKVADGAMVGSGWNATKLH